MDCKEETKINKQKRSHIEKFNVIHYTAKTELYGDVNTANMWQGVLV